MSPWPDPKRSAVLLLLTALLSAAYFLMPGSLPLIASDPETGASGALDFSFGQFPVLGHAQFMSYYERGGIFLVDARSGEEFIQGHIPGAVNIPYSEADLWLDSLDRMERPSLIIAYCDGGTCQASRELLSRIFFLFDSAAVYSGGWESWQEHE